MTAAAPPLVSARFPGPGARRVALVAGEALLAAMTATSALVTLVHPSAADAAPSTGDVVGFVAAASPAAFLWLRRHRPAPVLATCLALFAVAVFYAQFTPATVLPVAVALFAFVVRHTRRQGIWATSIVLALSVPLAWLGAGAGALDPEPFAVAVSVALAAALAESARNRRAYIAEIVARADHAEATRESEAARRVSEERLRIARDLHDVVAHQISLISLNASVALTALDARPEQARASLLTIRGASRRVLGDIGDLLAVLRSDEEPSLAPQPGLDQLPDLIDDFARAGLAVTVRHEGGAPQLTPACSLVAYRAVQEALTNATKHGAEARAHVLVSSEDDQVRVIVTNPAGAERFDGDGFGLSGMRERVASVRGTMEAGVGAGVFRLEIGLPRDAADAEQRGWRR